MSNYGFKMRARQMQTHSVTWSPILYFILEAMIEERKKVQKEWFNNLSQSGCLKQQKNQVKMLEEPRKCHISLKGAVWDLMGLNGNFSVQPKCINKEILMMLTLPKKDLLAGSSSSTSLLGLCSSDVWCRRAMLGFRATGGGSGLFPPAASLLLMVLLERES